MTDNKLRLVGYTRVSTTEQAEGYSLDAQDTHIKEWSNKENHTIVRNFVEAGQSARSDKRPTFQAMIRFVCHASQIDGVVVHKSDRFARNLLDYLNYRAILEQHGKRLFFVY